MCRPFSGWRITASGSPGWLGARLLLNKRMSLPSVLEIVVVSAAMLVAVLREYRLVALTGQQKSSVALRAFRIMGFLLVGFGVLGQILAAAGYG
jgi:hypothetical protein